MRLALLALAASVAYGQTTVSRIRSGGGGGSASGGYSYTFNVGPPPAFLPTPVLGESYSGDEVIETSQTLSDGSHLTHKTVRQRVYRDSQGRTRVESPAFPAASPMMRSVDAPPIVEIADPVAGTQCVLDMQDRVAHCNAVATRPQPPASLFQPPPMLPSGPPLPRGAESWGTQIISGVLALGVRTTQTIPAGTQGYDRAIMVVTDTWTSPELHITMLRKTSDPRTGENTFRIENFSRMEPEITLFQPPAGWLIQQDTGSFSITYSKP